MSLTAIHAHVNQSLHKQSSNKLSVPSNPVLYYDYFDYPTSMRRQTPILAMLVSAFCSNRTFRVAIYNIILVDIPPKTAIVGYSKTKFCSF